VGADALVEEWVQLGIALEAAPRSAERLDLDQLGFLVAFVNRVGGGDFALDFGGANLDILERHARIAGLKHLLELTILEDQAARLAVEEPVDAQPEHQQHQKQGAAAEPSPSALFASFLHTPPLYGGQARRSTQEAAVRVFIALQPPGTS